PPDIDGTHQTTICKSTPGARNEANHSSHGDTQVLPARPRNLETTNKTSWPTRQPDARTWREREQQQPKQHEAASGRTSTKKRQELSWENLTRTRPNQTAHFKSQGQLNSGPKRTHSTPGKNLRQKRQRAILGRTFTRIHNPHDQRTQTIRENTAESKTAEATQAGPGRTSTRTTKAPFREKLPERNSQTNSAPQTLRRHDNSRNERGTVLRETLTRTTANGSGKLRQNTRQPSDAPQPRGQRDNNQKRAQHSPGETSLPPEPTEKNSKSTSL
ncbi:hypothetical protein Taro_006901, partial [Colocasia esculenta]|nr:hypothetical protein [Colocasia esculenta]